MCLFECLLFNQKKKNIENLTKRTMMNVLHLNSKRKYQDSITDSRHFFIKYFYNIKAYENKLYI